MRMVIVLLHYHSHDMSSRESEGGVGGGDSRCPRPYPTAIGRGYKRQNKHSNSAIIFRG